MADPQPPAGNGESSELPQAEPAPSHPLSWDSLVGLARQIVVTAESQRQEPGVSSQAVNGLGGETGGSGEYTGGCVVM